MKEKQTKRKFEKYSFFALLCGIGLVAAGIFGIVSSRIESSEYKNSTDIRKVAAVIETLETHDEKDDNDVIVETKYKTRVSFEIDGKNIREDMNLMRMRGTMQKRMPMTD